MSTPEPSPYAYRNDPAVPAFDDSRALFVFDGTCVLCSGGASWLMRQARGETVRFASAQTLLGQALFRHFGLDPDETYLLVEGGRGWHRSDGYLRLCAVLGGPWRLLRATAIVPRPLRDWVYDQVARNRYRWFGRAEQCALLTPDQRARLL